jgi:hypothetical protein
MLQPQLSLTEYNNELCITSLEDLRHNQGTDIGLMEIFQQVNRLSDINYQNRMYGRTEALELNRKRKITHFQYPRTTT